MSEEHALLGPSSAHRWLACTPSARLEEGLPDTAGRAASEGTVAHAVAELKARKLFDGMGPRKYTTEMNKLKKDPLYSEEMQKHTDTYRDYLQEIAMGYPDAPIASIETRIDFGNWVPEGFGRGDCIIAGSNRITVVDFKYGKSPNGRVDAENNPQMMLYALGALDAYQLCYQPEKVSMAIVQPRLDHISEWEISVDKLLKWAEEYVKPRAAMAYAGEGVFSPGEKQCKFCRAKGCCKALAEYQLKIAEKKETAPNLIDKNELSEILHQLGPLINWAEAVKAYALQSILNGEEVPGWKAVAGRSARKWGNQEDAFNTLKANGIEEALLYKREPITLSAVEKLVGKKQFESICGSYVVKPYGAPTLAEESDPREPYSNAVADFAGLENTQ